MGDYQRDFAELKAALVAATEHRDERPDFDTASNELGWVLYERGVMNDATNRLRARRGFAPVSAEHIELAEMRASGHIDYVQKYALGCADLVHRIEPAANQQVRTSEGEDE